jgi:sn-glycerol 3-phosphate transport system substrate-binding protein
MPSVGARPVTAVLLALWLSIVASPARARTTIELWHGQSGANGQRFDELVQRFNASQGDYEARALFQRPTLPAVIAGVRANRPPHLALISDSGTQVMLLSRAVVPLAQLAREQGLTLRGGSFFEPVKACFLKDGLLQALPLSASLQLLYYNKDAFRRAGLDPSRAPATFAEVEAAATRVVASRSARCGFTHAWPSPVVEHLHAWHGQPLADQQDGVAGLATRWLVNGDFGTRLWETLVRWQRAGIYTYGGRERQGELLFTSGQCALLISGGSLVSVLEQGKFEAGTGPPPRLPGYPEGWALTQGSALWIMKGHGPREYAAVARFLEFVGDVAQQAWWHRATGYVPLSLEALRHLESEQWFLKHPGYSTAIDLLTGRGGRGPARCFRVGNLSALRDTIESELEAVLAGRKTPRQGLDDAVLQGDALLKAFADLYQ